MFRHETARPDNYLRILVCMALLVVLTATATPPVAAQSDDAPPFAQDLTVTVDCDAGETLTEALDERAENLTIEFTGSCSENLVIERDRVTIRGLDASASLTGSPVPEPAIFVNGGQGVRLESFEIVDSLFGVAAEASAGVELDDMTIQGSSSAGLALAGGSTARVVDSTFNDNGTFGISVFANSTLELEGTVEANDNIVGIIGSTGSGIEGLGTVISDRTLVAGLWLQIGASALVTDLQAADGINFGLVLAGGGSSFAGSFDLEDNFFGLVVGAQDVVDGSGRIVGAILGVLAEEDAHLNLGSSNSPVVISGLAGGIVGIGAAVDLSNTDVQGLVDLTFGSTLTTDGNTMIGVLQCDGTVLTRGPISCPAPFAGPEEGGKSLAPSMPAVPDFGLFEDPLGG